MQVTLTGHGEELLRQELARRAGQSPEQIVERALEILAGQEAAFSNEEREACRQAVADMQAFAEKHQLTLGPGARIKDLIDEGHRY